MACRIAPLVTILCFAAVSSAAQSLSAGTGTIFVGSYSGHLTAIDEATETVTKIPLKTGSPFAVRLSPDRSRFYVQSADLEHFEVVDVLRRQSLDTFTLGDARRHVRVLAYDVDPQHRTMVLVARTATKLSDRFEISGPEFIQYDLAEHRVVRTVPWSADPEPEFYFVKLRFSPDGKFLYAFGRQILVFDASSLQQVDSWDLSLPNESGVGRFDAGASDESADGPGAFTSLFTMWDAVAKRKLLVVGQLNMVARTLDFFPLGPAPSVGDLSFSVAPDRRRAYVLSAEIGHHELWTIDMAERRVQSRDTIPGRPRMQIRASSSGQVLYVYEAGHTIDLHAADGFRSLRTIGLDSDMMYGTFQILSASAKPAPPR